MDRYHYIHILWHNTDNSFFDDMVDSINRTFPVSAKLHYFITPYPELYNRLKKKWQNIELVKPGNLINSYSRFADYLVVHNLGCTRLSFLFTLKRNLKKVIWRTWGSDVPTIKPWDSNIIRFLKGIYLLIWKYKIKQIKVIACANLIDEFRFREMISDKVPYLYFGYTKYLDDDEMEKIENLPASKINHDGVNILVGHSAYSYDKHLEILDLLMKYSKEKITIYVNIVYGDMLYKANVLSELNSKYRNCECQIIPVTERMEKLDYLVFLNSMDVCIFGMETSAGLGNIANVLFLRKKIFYSGTSELIRALQSKGCHPVAYQDIPKLDFLDFCRKDEIEIGREYDLIGYKPCHDVRKKYIDIFKEIEEL